MMLVGETEGSREGQASSVEVISVMVMVKVVMMGGKTWS